MIFKVDTFKTQTYDGYPVELEIVIGADTAKIIIPDMIKWRVSAILPKDKAFEIYNSVFIHTYNELRDKIDFN